MNLHLIKREDTFALLDRWGDIAPGEGSTQGLYRSNTRFLSRLELTLNGVRPLHLGSTVKTGDHLFVAELMNPDLQIDGQLVVPEGQLHVFRAKLLWDGALYEHVRVTHFGQEPVRVSLALGLDADFSQLGGQGGAAHPAEGQRLPAERLGGEWRLGYRDADARLLRTRVSLRPAPVDLGEDSAQWTVQLQPQGEFHVFFEVRCETADEITRHPAPERLDYEIAYRRNAQERAARQAQWPGLDTSHPLMNRWLERSRADLFMLETCLSTGAFPCADLPGACARVDAEGFITAREVLWLDPSLARGVLSQRAASALAADDAADDGAVDTWPHFVALAEAYHRRTGDLGFIRELWPHVLAALAWMDRAADRDGFVHHTPSDLVFHGDGTLAVPPLALCATQASVYEARTGAAALAEALDEPALARRLHEQAHLLQQRFQAQFWCDDFETYAWALDAEKNLCRVATSSAGRAMWTGIAAPEHAQRMALRFLEPDFFTGFGVRTQAAGQARYNPMAPHQGALWPHDNALLAAGLARYGQTEAAVRVFSGLFDAVGYFNPHRLPPLFCGFTRREGEGPAWHPSAGLPQAVSAASVFALLQACLGLDIDAAHACVRLRAPRLPDALDWVRLRGLRVGDATLDLQLERHAAGVSVRVTDKEGDATVQVTL